MSKNQKPEQTPTEEAQGATAEQKAAEIATDQKAEEIAAEEQVAADKVKQDAEAAKESEQAEQAAKEQALLEAAKAAEAKYTVIMRFFSKDKIQYEIGDDVSHLDAERLDSLVNRGLVSKS